LVRQDCGCSAEKLESAITPDAEFVDNFFDLNDFSDVYAREGKIIEVQSYRVDDWLDRSDSDILAVVFRDLSGFLPRAPRDKLTHFHVQRHLALFTKYAPGRAALRPSVQSGVEGLYLAGDWTECGTNVWMMERAVVSGLRAANAILARRGMPLIHIVELPREGLLLRFTRLVSTRLRQMFWRNYPDKKPLVQRTGPLQPRG
jgi:uncharacterized protein with NAD-binding domain and iron-sulfur cluster